MKKTKGFGLFEIIIIIVITALVSSITTGVIVLNSSVEIDNETAKNIIEDEELMDFINVYETVVSKYYDEIDKEGMLKAAEEGMLNFLGDKYTTYLDDTEYSSIISELASTYNGIGITINNNQIVDITKDSPAEKAGLEVNDLILKINGDVVQEMSSEEIGQIIKNSDSQIQLEIIRNGLELVYSVEKTELINVSVNYEVISDSSIGYLHISKFSENLAEQVNLALEDLEKEGIKSLIIDVRDNVGGYLSAAEKTASLFLSYGKVIYSLQTSSNTVVYKDTTKEKREYPIIVLINNGSASAAEILASALKESYGATLVGATTYGKGKVQQIIGDSAKYTFAKWLTPNGTCIDGIGISPDYTVSNYSSTSVDNQLNKAIELLKD